MPTGGGGGTPAVSMEVSSILLSTVNMGKGNKQGNAEVTVLDDLGKLVSGAEVSGHFIGDFDGDTGGSPRNTDTNGVVTFSTSNTIKGKLSFGFCVDSVTQPVLNYSPTEPDCATF